MCGNVNISLPLLLQFLLDIIGVGEFLPNDALLDWLAKYVCSDEMAPAEVCEDVLFLICGFDKNNINIVSYVETRT